MSEAGERDTIRGGEGPGEQLPTALISRVLVEQAKGVLAQRGDLSMDAAADRLWRCARDHNLRLVDVARQIVDTGTGTGTGTGTDTGVADAVLAWTDTAGPAPSRW